MAVRNQYYNPGSPIVFGAAASAWNTSTVYAVGSLVTNGGGTYFCLLAHTSGTFATDLAALKWVAVTAVAWTPQNEAAGKGRISNACSLKIAGQNSLPSRYRFRASARWAATPTANDSARYYVVRSSDGVTAALTDGAMAIGDAEISSEANLSANAMQLPNAVIAATATDQLWGTSGIVEIFSPYIAIAAWNGAASKAFTNTASDHWLMLWPIPPCVEPAA